MVHEKQNVSMYNSFIACYKMLKRLFLVATMKL